MRHIFCFYILDEHTEEEVQPFVAKVANMFYSYVQFLQNNVHTSLNLAYYSVDEFTVTDDEDSDGSYYIEYSKEGKGYYSRITFSVTATDVPDIVAHEYGHHLYTMYKNLVPNFESAVEKAVKATRLVEALAQVPNLTKEEKMYMAQRDEIYARIHESLYRHFAGLPLDATRHYSLAVCNAFMTALNS